jgi:hypothetical protein
MKNGRNQCFKCGYWTRDVNDHHDECPVKKHENEALWRQGYAAGRSGVMYTSWSWKTKPRAFLIGYLRGECALEESENSG